jgi:uncharacterized protein YjbJ (UPF0337 family)
VGSVAANGITATSMASDALNAAAFKADAVTKIQAGLATPTNITAGIITTVTNLTNAPTNGDLTATMKSSITAAVPTAAAIGTDAAGKVLVTPAQKLVTDGSGFVTYSNAAPPSAATTAALILATPAQKLVTDANGYVTYSNAAPPAVGAIADAVWDEVVTVGAHDTATFAGKALLDAGGAGTPPTAAQIADAVWDEVVTTGQHDTATFAGKQLLTASAGGDPWATALPGAYGAGTAGRIMGRSLPDVSAGGAGGLAIVGSEMAANVTKVNGAAQTATLDTIKAETASILADTGELQTDWVNGGRLDLILDIIAADTTTDIPATITTMQGNVTSILADTNELQLNQGNWVTATGFATPTNITAGTITTVTNLTNAPTSGDLTATMKTSVQTAATAATPTAAAVTGNVGGNVTGSVGSVVGAVGSVTGAVGSVTGNVGGNVAGSVASVTGAVGSVTGNVGGNVAGSVASVANIAPTGTGLTAVPWNAAWDAEVQSEVIDALQTALAEMAQGIPPATPTIQEAIMYLYMAWRNKTETTASLLKVTNDAGTAITKATLSDNTTIFTKDKFISGA